MANYQMGLFREPERWAPEDARALVSEVLARAKLDALLLSNQPRQWRGDANPLATLGGRDSPSFAYSTRFIGDFEAWTLAHFSAASRKKRRAKTRRLAALGAPAHRRADTPAERRAALDAFFAQKQARMKMRGLPNEFDAPANVALVERLAALDPSVFELHVLKLGERCAAVFGGLYAHQRLSGLIFSHDVADDVAPMSPGEGLIVEIVRDGFARGRAEFDLGVGEARYKSECCETPEPLFDSAFAATLSGRLAAHAFLAARALKRKIKHAPKLFDWARAVERWGVRLRVR